MQAERDPVLRLPAQFTVFAAVALTLLGGVAHPSASSRVDPFAGFERWRSGRPELRGGCQACCYFLPAAAAGLAAGAALSPPGAGLSASTGLRPSLTRSSLSLVFILVSRPS